jgi:hypothetical protein
MTALLAVIALGFTACSDSDSSGGGQPEITGVRVCDPEKADSLFTKSAQGQTIAIIGHNLGGAKAVYINDQKVGFSSTMNTDHSIIVKVPSESDGFQLTAFNSDLKDEIRVETDGGVATYAFKVLGAGPVIQRIQGSYPRKTGDILNVYGLNLYSIEDMYFTDATEEELSTTKWEVVPGNRVQVTDYIVEKQDRYLNSNQSYEVSSQLALTTPDLPFDEGCLVIECAAGIVYIPYTKVPGKPVITSINTDMPIPGTDLIIKGREFVQVESVTYGDITLGPDDFTVAESEDQITIAFTEDLKPSAGFGTTLTVTTPGGTASQDYFYVTDGIILNFEDGFATDNGWGPNGTLMSEATSESIPYTSDGKFWRIKSTDGGWNWWATMCYFRKDWSGNSFSLPGFDLIPASTSTDDVYLAMEVWDNNTDFGGAQYPFLHYQIQTIGDAKAYCAFALVVGGDGSKNVGNWVDGDYVEKPLRAIDDTQPKEKWYRHVVKLSSFQTTDGSTWAGKTYGDVKAEGINQIRLMHMNWTGTPSTMDIMFDNVRILYVPAAK